MVNCRERSSSCPWRRAPCTILSNGHLIVVFVRIHCPMVNAHIGEGATNQQRVHPQAAQKQIEICGEEAAVATSVLLLGRRGWWRGRKAVSAPV